MQLFSVFVPALFTILLDNPCLISGLPVGIQLGLCRFSYMPYHSLHMSQLLLTVVLYGI